MPKLRPKYKWTDRAKVNEWVASQMPFAAHRKKNYSLSLNSPYGISVIAVHLPFGQFITKPRSIIFSESPPVLDENDAL